MARQAIEDGANLNDYVKWGGCYFSPIHMAVDCRSFKIIELLLESGVDINSRSNGGISALHFTAGGDDIEMVEFLISKGAEVNCFDWDSEEAPLRKTTNARVAEKLILNNADINVRNISGQSPLHLKVNDDTDVARKLLELGADPNAQDGFERSPLHTCCNQNGAALLLEFGADLNVTDFNNLTPLQYLELNPGFNRREVIEVIKVYQANVVNKVIFDALHVGAQSSRYSKDCMGKPHHRRM